MAKDELKLKLDFGAVKIVKREYGINFFGLAAKAFADPDVISAMILACARRGHEVDGGRELTEAELDGWTMAQVTEATTQVGELVTEFMAEQKDGDAGNAEGQS